MGGAMKAPTGRATWRGRYVSVVVTRTDSDGTWKEILQGHQRRSGEGAGRSIPKAIRIAVRDHSVAVPPCNALCNPGHADVFMGCFRILANNSPSCTNDGELADVSIHLLCQGPLHIFQGHRAMVWRSIADRVTLIPCPASADCWWRRGVLVAMHSSEFEIILPFQARQSRRVTHFTTKWCRFTYSDEKSRHLDIKINVMYQTPKRTKLNVVAPLKVRHNCIVNLTTV
ncbi:unnamed protein product [Pieris macdunnoughi]|uniref:Uncharacterized protein n=1 Tax=Pieris macdunnoughi TaxID=345717 RepID=A0A821VB25_9NEOP|nr:unnamed protein product [Pieris macdunnoughi]